MVLCLVGVGHDLAYRSIMLNISDLDFSYFPLCVSGRLRTDLHSSLNS